MVLVDYETNTTISTTQTLEDGTFCFELQSSYENALFCVKATSSTGQYWSQVAYNGSPLVLTAISTLIAEYCSQHSDVLIEEVISKILSNVGIVSSKYDVGNLEIQKIMTYIRNISFICSCFCWYN